MMYQAAMDMAYATISDNETDQHFITTTQMGAFANKALQEVVERTEHKDIDSSETITTGTITVDVGGDVSRFTRVEVDYSPLRTTTQKELRKYGTDWRSHDGTPRYYYRDEHIGDTPDQIIGLYPMTNASYNLRLTYIGKPGAVTVGQDMQIPDWASEAIVWSMLSDIYMVDTEIMNMEASGFYRYLFEAAVMRLRARSFDRLPKAWSYQTGPSDTDRYNIWNNMPAEIPQP